MFQDCARGHRNLASLGRHGRDCCGSPQDLLSSPTVAVPTRVPSAARMHQNRCGMGFLDRLLTGGGAVHGTLQETRRRKSPSPVKSRDLTSRNFAAASALPDVRRTTAYDRQALAAPGPGCDMRTVVPPVSCRREPTGVVCTCTLDRRRCRRSRLTRGRNGACRSGSVTVRHSDTGSCSSSSDDRHEATSFDEREQDRHTAQDLLEG